MIFITKSDYDHPYKRLFSHPEMMIDLIRGFLTSDFTEICDLTTLKRCNGSYVTDDLREREDDLIWSLRWGDRTLVLYLLIEFQSHPDPTMPIRIMSYMALLWQDLIRAGVVVPTGPLPGIIPIVLYNGEIPWMIPHDIGDNIQMPAPFIQFRPSMPYLLLDEMRLSLHHLIEVRNLAAGLFGLEQSSGSKELIELGEKLNTWMEINPTLEPIRRDFSLFFENSLKRKDDIPIPNPFRGGTMLAEKVNRWIAEYKAEGKAEGMATILRRMKNKGMSIAEMAQITDLSEEEIKHMI